MKRLFLFISGAFLCLLGCVFSTGNEKIAHSFVGEWKSTYEYEFTIADSLYRDSLGKYMLMRGIDIDSIFMIGSSYSYDTAVFNGLLREFNWNCPAGVACQDRIWLSTSKKKFTTDSVFSFTYKNGLVSDSFANAYSYTEDSILYPITPSFHLGEQYRFGKGGDTLILYGTLKLSLEMNDTLVRIR